MIQMQTNLDVADNSGARRVMCIMQGGRSEIRDDRGRRRVRQGGGPRGRVKGEVMKAVVVRIRKDIKRPDGSVIRFDNNAAVLIVADGADRHAHLRPRPARAARRNHMKIISLAPEVLVAADRQERQGRGAGRFDNNAAGLVDLVGD